MREVWQGCRWAGLSGLALMVGQGMAWADDTAISAPAVSVTGTVDAGGAEKRTGTAEEGYRVSEASMGPLGQKAALDTPYSVQTLPQELIWNQQVDSNAELLKYLPSTQIEYRGGADVGRQQSRGFESDLMGNTRIDGFAVQSHVPQPIELYDRLEVLSGLSGALYGPMNPAGVFNEVLKRPTDTPLRRLGAAYQSDGNYTLRGDVGGRFGAGDVFGYRANLAHTDGDTVTDTSNLRREVASLALDARVTPDTVVEVNAAHFIYDANGMPGSFAVAAGANGRLPDAPDPTKSGYAYDWSGVETTIDYYGVRATHKISSDWTLTGGLLRQNGTRTMRSVAKSLNAAGTSYTARASEAFLHWETTSNQLYLNGKADTFGLKHDVTVGTNGYDAPGFSAVNGAGVTGASSPACTVESAACALTQPKWKTSGGYYRTGLSNRYQTLILGDTIHLNDRLSVMGVFNNGWITKESTTGANAVDVNDARSYTAGVVYKLYPNMSLYANWASSVSPDPGQAPSTAVNAYDYLAPFRSKQVEAGYKVELSGLDVNAAAFRIERPIAYTGADNYYRVQGQQRNYGLEVMVKGKVTDDITVFGGVTWLDAKVSGTANAATDGNKAVGVPEWQANMLTEYKMPQAVVPDTTLSLNLHYTGTRAANDFNTAWADGYATVDLGARYEGDLHGHKFIARIGVNNLFDERYWASIFPGNIDGTGASTGSASTAFMGESRTFKASMSVDF